MTERCRNPIELGDLAAYQLGELDTDRERAIEQHYFGCSECSARLSWLGALSQSIAEQVRAGRVSSNVSSAWVKRAAEGGMRLRSYELRAGSPVACTVAPDDDFVIVRLRVDKALGGAVDLETEMTDLSAGTTERRDLGEVFVDPETLEIVYAFSGDVVRSFPRSRWVMHVRAQGSGDRLGPYTMDHTPWPGASP